MRYNYLGFIWLNFRIYFYFIPRDGILRMKIMFVLCFQMKQFLLQLSNYVQNIGKNIF